MTTSRAKIRIFIPNDLNLGAELSLPEDVSHYLANVMRLQPGDVIAVFNGLAGEFECQITVARKKQVIVKVLQQNLFFQDVPDIWLLFAPVKKDKTDFIIEKAVELGVKKILPVITERTIVEKVKTERYVAQAVEAAEQCRRLEIPEILSEQKLSALLAAWPSERCLFFMDESGQGQSAAAVFSSQKGKPAAVLVGPEGGFSPAEMQMLRQHPSVQAVSLGSRILRAETAVAAALSVWQSVAGDWN